MTYDVVLEKRGKIIFLTEYFLDGLYDKELILHTRADFIERLGLCDKCYGCMDHIICNDIDPEGYTNKFCPIFFYDVIKPSWKLEEVEGFQANLECSVGHFKKRSLSGVWDD
jgi:hypothetical protein